MKNFFRISFLSFLLFGGMLLSLSAQRLKQYDQLPKSFKPEQMIAIVGVNDMHATIDNMPRLAYMVDSLRDIYPNLLLLAAGDNQTGNPINDAYSPKGWPMIALMNELKFDASAMGNHEFDTNPEGFGYLASRANFQFLSANVFFAPSYGFTVDPYKYFTLPNGSTVLVLSLLQINESGIPDTHPARTKGVSFEHPSSAWARYSYLKGSADLFLLLTHLGYEDDIDLVMKKGGADIVVGGHSHTAVEEAKQHNGTLVTQTGSKLRNLSLTLVALEGKDPVAVSTSLLPIDPKGTKKESVAELVDKFNKDPRFSEIVGISSFKIDSEDPLGQFMTDAYRDYTGVDIAFQNPGGVRISSLSEGNISLFDVLRLDPFGNEIMTFTMKGVDIQKFLIHAWSRDRELPMYTSGVSLQYILDGENKCLDCIVTLPDGSSIDLDKEYSIVSNSYITAAYDYAKQAKTKNHLLTSAECITQYLKKIGEIPSSVLSPRFKFIKQE